METNVQSSSQDIADARTVFRKPSNDTTNRNYRRRSPVSLSSSDESPRHDRSSSPISSRDHARKAAEDLQTRKGDRRDIDKDCSRYQHERTGESYRSSDRQSTRNSHGYSRHDDNQRHDKYADDDERNYRKLSSRSGRDSRGRMHLDRVREESEYNRSRDHLRNVDKYLRDKYDSSGHRSRDKEREASYGHSQRYKDLPSERSGSSRRHGNSLYEEIERDRHGRDRDVGEEKRDYHRSSGDYRSERANIHEESRGHRHESTSRRDDGGHRRKEGYKNDPREELEGQKNVKGERRYDERETYKDNDQCNIEAVEKYDDKGTFATDAQGSPAKRTKFSSSVDEKPSSTLKQAEGIGDQISAGQTPDDVPEAAGDVNAAKVAAMKAAELVNRNLSGVGMSFMTAEQKKKLLWGNKKSTTAEEPGHRWDTALFGDRERQEKFNKLMGVKGDVKIEQKPENQEKQKELQLDLEKQYTAGLRRRDGRTVGLGL